MANVDHTEILSKYGLRITRPRAAVVRVLFGDGENRHVTAEWVAERLEEAGEGVALATVYNTLNNFAEVGMLNQFQSAERGAVIFDTNTKAHHHFYNETTQTLSDIASDDVKVMGLPTPPEGTSIVGWDLVVRVK